MNNFFHCIWTTYFFADEYFIWKTCFLSSITPMYMHNLCLKKLSCMKNLFPGLKKLLFLYDYLLWIATSLYEQLISLYMNNSFPSMNNAFACMNNSLPCTWIIKNSPFKPESQKIRKMAFMRDPKFQTGNFRPLPTNFRPLPINFRPWFSGIVWKSELFIQVWVIFMYE